MIWLIVSQQGDKLQELCATHIQRGSTLQLKNDNETMLIVTNYEITRNTVGLQSKILIFINLIHLIFLIKKVGSSYIILLELEQRYTLRFIKSAY